MTATNARRTRTRTAAPAETTTTVPAPAPEPAPEPAAAPPTAADQAEAPARTGFTVTLPLVTTQFRAPTLPGVAGLTAAARGAAAKLPPPKVTLFYGGLAAVAALGAITWPVAVAVGVGTAVARHAGVAPKADAAKDAD